MFKEVKKVWGKELWIVNCDKYCGKFLYLDKGATSSYHYHKEKQETFFILRGQIILTIENGSVQLNPLSEPVTIMPNQKHKFFGITDATILEVSTQHDDKDVYRLEESKSGVVSKE